MISLEAKEEILGISQKILIKASTSVLYWSMKWCSSVSLPELEKDRATLEVLIRTLFFSSFVLNLKAIPCYSYSSMIILLVERLFFDKKQGMVLHGFQINSMKYAKTSDTGVVDGNEK